MKRKSGLFVASMVLMAISRTAGAECIQNAGRVAYISYFGAQPVFSLIEYPSISYTFDPSYTPEQRRILLNLLQIAITTGLPVQVVCNSTNVLGVSVRAN